MGEISDGQTNPRCWNHVPNSQKKDGRSSHLASWFITSIVSVPGKPRGLWPGPGRPGIASRCAVAICGMMFSLPLFFVSIALGVPLVIIQFRLGLSTKPPSITQLLGYPLLWKPPYLFSKRGIGTWRSKELHGSLLGGVSWDEGCRKTFFVSRQWSRSMNDQDHIFFSVEDNGW